MKRISKTERKMISRVVRELEPAKQILVDLEPAKQILVDLNRKFREHAPKIIPVFVKKLGVNKTVRVINGLGRDSFLDAVHTLGMEDTINLVRHIGADNFCFLLKKNGLKNVNLLIKEAGFSRIRSMIKKVGITGVAIFGEYLNFYQNYGNLNSEIVKLADIIGIEKTLKLFHNPRAQMAFCLLGMRKTVSLVKTLGIEKAIILFSRISKEVEFGKMSSVVKSLIAYYQDAGVPDVDKINKYFKLIIQNVKKGRNFYTLVRYLEKKT